MSIKTGQFKKLCNHVSCFFFRYRQQSMEHSRTFMEGFFAKKLTAKNSYLFFVKELHHGL